VVGGLSFALLTLSEFHPTQLPIARVAEGLLCSSTMTAIISVMLSTMLLFTFEGHETATRKDLAIAWSPLLLLELCIGEYLLGLMFWYSGKNKGWTATMMRVQLAVLLLYSYWVAIWMWQTMSRRGGLGKEEEEATVGVTRLADIMGIV
jgi:hypothetical protein